MLDPTLKASRASSFPTIRLLDNDEVKHTYKVQWKKKNKKEPNVEKANYPQRSPQQELKVPPTRTKGPSNKNDEFFLAFHAEGKKPHAVF